MAKTPLQELADHGQSVWIDYLSRPFVQDGDLAGLVDQGIKGVTSNPTIFQGAIAEGDAYDDQIREIVSNGETEPKEIFIALASDDISAACDVLRPVHDEGGGKDGYVSFEVDPNLAHDTEGTIEEAKRLHALIDKPNLFIKIPATKEGLPAIEETIAAGIPVNVTLIFSLERHREVAEAYLRGIERLAETGGTELSRIASVASFFVSRVDTEADKRLDAIGGHDELKGTLAIANAKLAYQSYKEIFAGERWEALKAKGATAQRCLWASTSTKNPEYRDVIYVEELIGRETVDTMPRETVEAFQDHGRVADTLEDDVEGARKVLAAFAEAGIDYDDVVETLEREGVEKFAKSFEQLFSSPEWLELEAKGATKQRPLWASTSTKNPAYRDVVYVEELVGPDTVNTMPRETADAMEDHGNVDDTLERDVEGAREVLQAFADAGIDYDDVVETLEREGVEKFAKSFEQLFADVEAKRDSMVPA